MTKKLIALILITLSTSLSSCALNTKSTSSNISQTNAGNIHNSGYIALQDDWIYYANNRDEHKLYKMRSDGTENILLSDEPVSYINVSDGWIYYRGYATSKYNISKIRTSGEDKTVLKDIMARNITVCDNIIYFTGSSYENPIDYIYKMSINGLDFTQLNTDDSAFINIVNNWIYYVNESDNFCIYKLRIDGTEKTKLNDTGAMSLSVIGDWIYYTNTPDYNIYKMRIDGTEITKLCTDACVQIVVSNDWIYYIDNSDFDVIYGSLYKIQTNGSGKKQLSKKGFTPFYYVYNEYIYYYTYDKAHSFYRMNLNGKKLKEFNAEA